MATSNACRSLINEKSSIVNTFDEYQASIYVFVWSTRSIPSTRTIFPPSGVYFYSQLWSCTPERCNASSLRVLTKSYTVRDTGERTQAEALTRL